MSREIRTLIELSDITGVEFECRKCGAKVLYPFRKEYERPAERCPSCGEPWFADAGMQHPSASSTADQVKKVIASMMTMAASPLVHAQVRLAINIETDKKS
jgi:DNA-directed RNA polymerase subunit RPC12/RpoP